MKETKQIYYKLFVLVKRWEKIKVKVEEAGRNAVRRVDEQDRACDHAKSRRPPAGFFRHSRHFELLAARN